MYTRLVYTITILSLQIHDLTPIVFANSLLHDIFFFIFFYLLLPKRDLLECIHRMVTDVPNWQFSNLELPVTTTCKLTAGTSTRNKQTKNQYSGS